MATLFFVLIVQELSHDALSSSSEEEEIDDVSSVVSSRMTVDDLELSEGVCMLCRQ